MKYLEQFSEFLPTLTAAHSLARLLVVLCKTCKAEHLKKPIGQFSHVTGLVPGYTLYSVSKQNQQSHSFSLLPATACGSLLKRPWRVSESGSQRSEALDCLLRYHLEWADAPLDLAESIAGESIAELLGEEPPEESSVYPTLSK